MAHTREELLSRQALPLEFKVRYTLIKIREWLDYCREVGKVPCVAKSGMDSVALLDLVRHVDPTVAGVFVNTGQENTTVVVHNRSLNNVIEVRPDLTFDEVVKRFGYPAISKQVSRYLDDIQNPTPRNEASRVLRLTGMKQDGTKGSNASALPKCYHRLIDCGYKFSNKCCYYLKHKPMEKIQRELKMLPMIGTLAEDSETRAMAYLKSGCNAFDAGKSQPISIWLRQDVLRYVKVRRLAYPECYGEIVEEEGVFRTTGESNTGCEGCLYGIKYDPQRIERVKQWSPARYRYYMEDLDYKNLIPLLLKAYK